MVFVLSAVEKIKVNVIGEFYTICKLRITYKRLTQ